MKFDWQISAGEFFELLRPAALVVSGLLSVWVLASARRWRLNSLVAIGWSLGTFFFPFVVLPLYLIARVVAKRRTRSSDPELHGSAAATVELPAVTGRFIVPLVYSLFLLSLICAYLYRDYNSLDAHLARASQATVMNQRERAIREYHSALALEDNPHTHKLLGIAFADAGKWAEALREFRTAESGGEPDESLAFRVGQALESLGKPGEARLEYEKFLNSPLCTQPLRDHGCASAQASVGSIQVRPTP